MMTRFVQLRRWMVRLAQCQSGQTLAEYGIMVAAIAIVVIAAAVLLGGSISSLFISDAARV